MKNRILPKQKVQISSGGFIFNKDLTSGGLYVLLIKNRKGEMWVPKGKLEKGEDQVSAAFREIEEEVGLKKDQMQYIGFCFLDKYSYTEKDERVEKELYLNVFESDSRHVPKLRQEEVDIMAAEWYPYQEAIDIISFNKEELKKAKDIFYHFHGY